MKKLVPVSLLAAGLLAGCMWVPVDEGGYGAVEAPALPPVVVLETEPYYSYSGYYYFYDHDNWSYSRSRGGPWRPLPRERWPGEVHIRGGWGGAHDRGAEHEHERE